jgi:TolB-like protein
MMRLYGESGRRGAAIQLYKVLSEALQRDLNTLPEADTSQLFHILMQPGEASQLTPLRPQDNRDIAKASTVPEGAGIAQKKPLLSVALACSLIVLIALASYWWISKQSRFAAGNREIEASGARTTAASRPLAVAVLPFENLSGDPDQEFFSDGMTEEISSALSKVPGLVLIARTSAFQFRGNRDARQVGRILGARYVLEGAVRKKGDRVRITAQLVRTDAGRLVWSDTYERQLTDVFAIQEDIAKAIASELRLSISLPTGENLVSSRDVDPNAYEQFLRARPLIRARQTGVDQAIQILEPLVGRNPKFAPAWALLSQAYSTMVAHASPYTTVPGHPDILQRTVLIEKYWPKAEASARQAIMLNPSIPEGYVALGQLMSFRGKFAMADDLLAKALAIDRYNPDALGLRMNLMADTGQTKKASQIAEQLLALDPYVPTWKQDAAEVFWEAGQTDKAIRLLTSIIERPSVPSSLAMIYAADGRFADAAKVLNDALKARGEMRQNLSTLWRNAVAIIQTAPAKLAAGRDRPILGRLDWAYLYVGAPEQALEHYESDVRTGLVGGAPAFGWVWHSSYAPARRTTQFKTLMKIAGFADYWRGRGWPELCRPLGSSDFECH